MRTIKQKELKSELDFYSAFYKYVKQNNYQTYCNAVQHATKENNNQLKQNKNVY